MNDYMRIVFLEKCRWCSVVRICHANRHKSWYFAPRYINSRRSRAIRQPDMLIHLWRHDVLQRKRISDNAALADDSPVCPAYNKQGRSLNHSADSVLFHPVRRSRSSEFVNVNTSSNCADFLH